MVSLDRIRSLEETDRLILESLGGLKKELKEDMQKHRDDTHADLAEVETRLKGNLNQQLGEMETRLKGNLNQQLVEFEHRLVSRLKDS